MQRLFNLFQYGFTLYKHQIHHSITNKSFKYPASQRSPVTRNPRVPQRNPISGYAAPLTGETSPIPATVIFQFINYLCPVLHPTNIHPLVTATPLHSLNPSPPLTPSSFCKSIHPFLQQFNCVLFFLASSISNCLTQANQTSRAPATPWTLVPRQRPHTQNRLRTEICDCSSSRSLVPSTSYT